MIEYCDYLLCSKTFEGSIFEQFFIIIVRIFNSLRISKSDLQSPYEEGHTFWI